MQLVVHAPFGGRINRALGLALRKRFCRRFDFELQAAASDDAIVLSLGPQHSFPLEDVPHFLTPRTAPETLAQALLLSPMFQVRWRWNLGRALVVLRQRGGRRNPPPIQRMEADDLMAAVFPALAACQENAGAGPSRSPTTRWCARRCTTACTRRWTSTGSWRCSKRIEAGEVRAALRDTTEPSPLAHEILNGRPYTFLDDAPLEERRTRAVALRRGLPESARELGRLDPDAIARVRDEARPEPRDAEELHDALLELVVLRPEARVGGAGSTSCAAAGRAARVPTRRTGALWLATERRGARRGAVPGRAVEPDVRAARGARGRAAPGSTRRRPRSPRRAGTSPRLGPATAAELAGRTALGP